MTFFVNLKKYIWKTCLKSKYPFCWSNLSEKWGLTPNWPKLDNLTVKVLRNWPPTPLFFHFLILRPVRGRGGQAWQGRQGQGAGAAPWSSGVCKRTHAKWKNCHDGHQWIWHTIHLRLKMRMNGRDCLSVGSCWQSLFKSFERYQYQSQKSLYQNWKLKTRQQ